MYKRSEYFTREDTQMANNHLKMFQTSLVIMEMNSNHSRVSLHAHQHG